MAHRSKPGPGTFRLESCAQSATNRLGAGPRIASGPAVMRAASRGRTHDRTRPRRHNVISPLRRRGRPHTCLRSGFRPPPPRAEPRRHRPGASPARDAGPAGAIAPRRAQRAKLLCSVGKGIPESQPAMRHCMPPKVSIQIRPISRRRSARSGLPPQRCTLTRSCSMASSSASTAKTNASMATRTSQPSPRRDRGTRRAEGGDRSAMLWVLVRDIGPTWSAQAAWTIYVSKPAQPPQAISDANSNRSFSNGRSIPTAHVVRYCIMLQGSCE